VRSYQFLERRLVVAPLPQRPEAGFHVLHSTPNVPLDGSAFQPFPEAAEIATRAYDVAEALDKERVERVAKRSRAAPDAPA
jgi:hypothetical protein